MSGVSVSMSDVGRLANRAKRQAIATMPPLRKVVETQRARRVVQHSTKLPPLNEADEAVVADLRAHGVHMTTLDTLAGPRTPALKSALEALVASLAARTDVPAATVRPTTDELLADPGLWRFGLDERMLAIAENYLGLPVRYYGADVRREIADGEARDVRQWHRDIEDQNNLKILVWLNDVDADGGPFAYIPLERSRQAARQLHYVAGFVNDERMRQVVPEDEWRTCPGPTWTAVMADNVQLMHRATPPRARDRYSVTFTWTTRNPVKTMPQEPLTPAQARRITEGLTRQQLASLPRAVREAARG